MKNSEKRCSEDPKKIDKNKYTTLEDGVTTCCGYDY